MLLDRSISVSYVFGRVKKDFFRLICISALIQGIKIVLSDDLPAIPISLASVLGASISLLLAFKLNQSYDRWWEARKTWGAIVNDSRSLILQLRNFIPGSLQQETTAQLVLNTIANRQIAWCYCLGQSLRGLDALQGLDGFLAADELADTSLQNNKPLYLLSLHGQDIRKLKEAGLLDSFQQVQLDNTIVRLCDSMGRSERIRNTVFPATYRRLIHFFIYLFLVILSISLVETVGYYEIPLLTLIGSTFFLVEKTAKDMQDPFTNKPTDTAVTSIARTIEINIKQLLGLENVPAPLEPGKFYLM